MLFNSFEFLLLVVVVGAAYPFLSLRKQNALLLAASYVFYGWWDYRFLALLAASTLVDYAVALGLERTESPRRRRALLVASCCVGLGLLGLFKYWGLFASTANGIGHWLGIESALLPELRIVLPVGISFYTFQTLAYTIDVYRRRQPACRSLPDFALYVSFFPQLVAGPIERASHLLPQIQRERRVSIAHLEQGAFLFASGWFRKSLGDVLGAIADPLFDAPAVQSGWDLLWGAYVFAFQIYLDFSGYSDMARGVARAFGFDLMVNFHAPYFSRNVREFWRRWHISLSTWLLDYLYIPLGGGRGSRWRQGRNLFATMFLSGLWHGAAWNFAAWGVAHGACLAGHAEYARRRPPGAATRVVAGLARRARAALSVFVTFQVVALVFVLFRAQSVGDVGPLSVAGAYLGGLARLASDPWTPPPSATWLVGLVLLLDAMIVRTGSHLWLERWPWAARAVAIAGLVLTGFILGSGENRAFIYFQF